MAFFGAIFFGYNTPGCFIWANVLENGRVHVLADYKFRQATAGDIIAKVRSVGADLDFPKFTAVYGNLEMFPKDDQTKAQGTQWRGLEAEPPSDVFARSGLPLVPSGANRQHGWQRIHEFLRLAPDGKPWLLLHSRCRWLRRTLPAVTQLESDPEDLGGEDYAVNALRVLLSARPTPSATTVPRKAYPYMTVGWLRGSASPRRGVLSR